ncbi:MAG: hypothetical protein QNJ29_04730 [Rhizobiaceae bacterium]|nr:hypothetical protein [Rhizobiaceae bacterium]
MTKGCDYKIFGSDERFADRAVVRINAAGLKSSPENQNRTFVPFAGFDGQQLAGTGALVWEGELLSERLH